MKRALRGAGLTLAVMLLWALPVAAQDAPADSAPPATAQGVSREATPPPATEPVQVRMEEVEIQGEIERPGVFYIIPRREVEMDLGTRTKDYREEILQPLLPAAFERWARQAAAGSPR